MAKKDKPETGEEYEFTPPDFNEEEFIHKELTGFRTTAILIVWAVVAALGGWLLFTAVGGGKNGWYASLALAAAFGYALKFLFPKFGADIGHFKRKEWIGTGFLFFFTWLAIMVIVLNPPVSDNADPQMSIYLGPPQQAPNQDVVLDYFLYDNQGIDDFTLSVTRGAETLFTEESLINLSHGHYQLTMPALSGGEYVITATATDEAGRKAEHVMPMVVSRTTIDYDGPRDDRLVTADDHVRIGLPSAYEPCRVSRAQQILVPNPCVRSVFLSSENGNTIQMAWDDDSNSWEAGSDHPGWVAGNNTFTAHVQFADQFHGNNRVVGREITAGPYSVTVEDDDIGTNDDIPLPFGNPAKPPVRQVPGIGLAVIVLGILGLAGVVRRA